MESRRFKGMDRGCVRKSKVLWCGHILGCLGLHGVCCFGMWLLIVGLRMVVAEAGSGRDGCSCWLNLGHFGAWIC